MIWTQRSETRTKTERIAAGNPKAQYGASGLIIAKNTFEKLVSSVPNTEPNESVCQSLTVI